MHDINKLILINTFTRLILEERNNIISNMDQNRHNINRNEQLHKINCANEQRMFHK